MHEQVRLHGVRVRPGRGAAVVLDRVDLGLPAGTVTAVLGGNGSGKSSLLRVIAGVAAPAAGRVDRPAGAVGYLPDRFPARHRMTALSYLRHMGRLRGLGPAAARARAEDLLAALDLQPGPDTAISLLSKGNAQKVALAQALLVPPALLVLDEPWSGTDAQAHRAVRTLIGTARDGGAAVVVAEHRLDAARSLADTAYRIADRALRSVVLPADRGPQAVIVLRRDGQRRRREVPAARCDAVLAEALRDGWSVVEVRREDAAEDGADR